MQGRLRKGGKCLGWTGWSRGREGELGSGLRLLGARAFERGGQVLGVWGVDSGVDKVVLGPIGRMGSGLRLLGTRAFEKGGQVLGVVRVVLGPRGQTGEWAQAAWCEGV